MRAVVSKHGVPIRLTDERWAHIVTGHNEMTEMRQQVLDTVAEPERILAGNAGEYLAVRTLKPGKWLVVIYRELVDDGFVITAFMTRRARMLDRRAQIWP